MTVVRLIEISAKAASITFVKVISLLESALEHSIVFRVHHPSSFSFKSNASGENETLGVVGGGEDERALSESLCSTSTQQHSDLHVPCMQRLNTESETSNNAPNAANPASTISKTGIVTFMEM